MLSKSRKYAIRAVLYLSLNSSEEKKFSPKEIKMAIGVASDKRYAGGNMTGAVKAIEKMKKGLSDHPQVKAVLRRQNEAKLDPVNKKALKKDFDDRKDKDIDNDGDTDSSDKFLHKKRKAISKAISKDEGNAFGKALKDAKEKGEKTFVVAGKEYKVKEELAKENFEVGTKERTDHTLNVTPGQSPEEFEKQVETMQAKNNYMREALAKMWGIDEGKNPFIKDAAKKQEEKKVKSEKTMTGKKATEVKVDPDLDK